eukprot:365029-Chlamydomonas_euryale.AAC.6
MHACAPVLPACLHACLPVSRNMRLVGRTHARMHACTHARMHACTHARMHASAGHTIGRNAKAIALLAGRRGACHLPPSLVLELHIAKWRLPGGTQVEWAKAGMSAGGESRALYR